MRVLHVIRSTDPLIGGPTQAVENMARALIARGISVDVAATVPLKDEKANPTGRSSLLKNGARFFYFPRQLGTVWCLSVPLWRWIRARITDYDAVHIHGVFTFPVLMAARAARRSGVPYVIRPAGTLDIYPMTQKAWRKKLYYRFFLKSTLARANAIHATSASERNQLALLGLAGACTVIPLAVDLPVLNRAECQSERILRLLFLSRIHPKKGLPILLRALAVLRDREIEASLTIAGQGSKAYQKELKRLIDALGLHSTVEFVGFVTGKEKSRLLALADLFVLPSYQENFGIAVAEAMAAGLPVVISDQVALAEEIIRGGAGVVVPVDQPEALADAIGGFTKPGYRFRMGRRARQLVERHFASDIQGQRLEELYRRIVARRADHTGDDDGFSR